MPHYRILYPSEYLNAADLLEKSGGEAKLTIEKVAVEEVPGSDGSKKPKPVVWFKGAKKRMPLPKICAKKIAGMFGNNTDDWVGKEITVYATTCQAFGQETECIRVR